MERIYLNNDWSYSREFQADMLYPGYNDESMETVRLPHTNTETPYHYFDEQIYQFISYYRRNIAVSEAWKGKQVLLTFEGVAHIASVYINGKKITTHYGGYTAFTLDIEPYLDFSKDTFSSTDAKHRKEEKNVLVVEVDSRESNNLPPFGNVIDYMTYGGIYREVYLEVKNAISIQDAYVVTHDRDDSTIVRGTIIAKDQKQIATNKSKDVDLQVTLHGAVLKDKLKLIVSLADDDQKTVYSDQIPVSSPEFIHRFDVREVEEWDTEHPVLYTMKLELFDEASGSIIDHKRIRFGFRTCEFNEDGFYLNGKKLKLIGLNRHQSFPYVGYAMPKRMQWRDAEILKRELGVNAVRTSHYPQSQHFIDRCDELGLLVFTEIPGWQHIGDVEWKNIACDNVREMILQYRNHPSIILWGVRINESHDDDAFYTKTNRIAHNLDPFRQTGGVRYLKKSNLLEDVYTYNDFLHNGRTKGLDQKKDVTSKAKAPYLVSEFNGHMFPTKAFDQEELRLDHALRHSCVLDAAYEQEGLSGAFGWCMFDYNTHKDFGSGDRICYHGVMDMFRNPKLAAAVYASQSDDSVVCEISSSLDIGEHPAGDIKDVYVFTNADCIRLYKNDAFVREFYPERDRYPALPHPPVIVNDFVGDLIEKNEHYDRRTARKIKKLLYEVKKHGPNNLPLRAKLGMASLMLKEHLTMEEAAGLYYKYIGSWGGKTTSFRLEAVKDNKVVKTIRKNPATQVKLQVSVSTNQLKEEETYDVAAVRITAVDENDNRLPYYQEPVSLEVRGDLELIGPKLISLKGGMGGTYVKTNGRKGDAELVLHQSDIGEVIVRFSVI